jgi:hypothetical protein
MIDIGPFLPKTQQFDFKVKRASFERRILRVHTHKPNGAPSSVFVSHGPRLDEARERFALSIQLGDKSAHAISARS